MQFTYNSYINLLNLLKDIHFVHMITGAVKKDM